MCPRIHTPRISFWRLDERELVRVEREKVYQTYPRQIVGRLSFLEHREVWCDLPFFAAGRP